jgi:hypothetical protein
MRRRCHLFDEDRRSGSAWMAGTRPAMTTEKKALLIIHRDPGY